jgi:hypothetical protein
VSNRSRTVVTTAVAGYALCVGEDGVLLVVSNKNVVEDSGGGGAGSAGRVEVRETVAPNTIQDPISIKLV